MAADRSSLIATLALATTIAGCAGNGLLTRFTLAPSPHERYADALRDNALSETALARDWLRAADTALAQPLALSLPMHESGYFAADHPSAVAYRLELRRGRRLSVEIAFESADGARLFVDVFEAAADQAPARIASLTEGSTLALDVPRDGAYLLRVQPELLRGGRYTVVQRTLASLPFPVKGLTARAVQSEFGAARDAGRREHEGVDIFAPRDTPVVAVASGVARSGTNPLGGNVVWLRDRREARSFYYAHLSRAAFEGTSTVRAGEVVGFVGNTGNARTTAPHLHFGIYQRDAVDPQPFLRADDPVPGAAADTSKWLSELVRVTAAAVALRSGPSGTASTLARLRRASLARVTGVTEGWLRVQLPDRSAGYLDRSGVTVARTPLRRQTLQAGDVIRERPDAAAPAIGSIDEPVAVDVLGEFNGFAFVLHDSSPTGWIEPK